MNIMEKKWFIICLFSLVLLCSISCSSEKTAEPIDIEALVERLQTIDSDVTLGSTKYYKMTLANDQVEDLYYYYIQTEYAGSIPKVEGLHMAAIGAVVEYFYAEDSHEIMVNGKKAVIYTFPNKEYLCWTLSPEDSCVIEYVPGTLHEADIIMIAESVS